MHVILPPVVVGSVICRIVAPLESLLEVEAWVEAWWEPSAITLSDAAAAPAATSHQLIAAGVPRTDWALDIIRPDRDAIEALIRAREPQRPSDMRFDQEEIVRLVPPPTPEYPGNSRFRRHTAQQTPPDITAATHSQPPAPPPRSRRR